MGCNASRLDRLPAVSLCRDRCKFIDESLRQSYSLADAHVAHMESLRTLGPTLLHFFQQFEDSSAETKPSLSKPSPPRSKSSSSSDSDAEHVPLHSESEPEDTEKESQLCTHSYRRYDYLHHDTVLSSVPDNVTFMTYVKPIYDSYSPPPTSNTTGNFSELNPPSPPPPSNSAWEFLDFFEPYEKFKVRYSHGGDGYTDTNVTDEKEKEKDNGHVTQKSECVKSNGVNKNEEGNNKEADLKEDSSILKKKLPELEECSKKVESGKGFSETVKEIQVLFERASDSGNVILEMLDVGKLRYHSKIELNPVSCKIMHLFPSSNPLMVKCVESPCGRKADCQGVYKDKGISYENLCSTLSKLCIWEKKLYHEVKAEEKLRTLHEKKCKQLRRMNKKDDDAQKINSVKAFISILVTKMKVSIQVVDKISNSISKLTEEELWPQINRFILMFLGMWKDMQECYKRQYQEIVETKALDVSSFNRKPCNANIDAAIKLKSKLQKWNLSFLDWIQAQKFHVKALNDWLVRCLMYESEELQNDSTPFGAPPVFVLLHKWSKTMDNISEKNVIEAVNGFMLRVNELLKNNILELQKNSTLDKEIEKKVKILDRQEQKLDKMVKARERKMVPIAKELGEVGDAVHNNDDVVDSISLQSGLKQIFVAMEKFSATTASLYEELSQQIKQDHVLGESNKNH